MAASISSQNATAARLDGVHARARHMVQRATACAAATVLICAAAAALAQLVAEILSFPALVAVTAITPIAATLLHSLRRQPGRRHGLRGIRAAPNGKPSRI